VSNPGAQFSRAGCADCAVDDVAGRTPLAEMHDLKLVRSALLP